MNPLLEQIIRQEAARREIGKYTLSSQSYVLVNNGAVTPDLPRTDESVSFNLFVGEGLPLKALEFRLEQNLLFLYRLDAYFADYNSYVRVSSKSKIVRYDYLTNSALEPMPFADEYRLYSDLVTVHDKDVRVEASFMQSKMCRATLFGVLLRRED